MQAMSQNIYVKRSLMEDGEFLYNLKKQKPAGTAPQVVIFPGLMTGSNRLFTYLIKTYKHFYPEDFGTGRIAGNSGGIRSRRPQQLNRKGG
jgi:hypothetical protein